MKKKTQQTILIALVFLLGLSILLYPTVSNWWNERIQSRAIVDYDKALAEIKEEDYTDIVNAAHAYNEELSQKTLRIYDPLPSYFDQLVIEEHAPIGYLTIPVINIQIPFYHTSSEAVLNVGVGHLEGTSLPIGGANTHAVLTAHRGLPKAKLFTDLPELQIGDRFKITVLNDVLTYQVDQIKTVEPHELQDLDVVKDKDYVTLFTCTPYGINTHRVLVRGERIETNSEETPPAVNEREANASIPYELIILGVVLLVIIIIVLTVRAVRRKRRNP